MVSEYWKKVRQDILPHIKDWSSDHNYIRNEYDVSKLDFFDWLWLHPSAFKLLHYGNNCIFMLIFGLIGWFVKNNPIRIVLILIVIAFFWDLIKKIRNRRVYANYTLYDRYLRDKEVPRGVE